MSSAGSARQRAIDRLQSLGLKEYEARCFVGLTRIPSGTAKDIGKITDVPRTRVYDAVEGLEERGLVEVQHTDPKRFRAVSVDEALDRLRAQYDRQIRELDESLRAVDPVTTDDAEDVQSAWSLPDAEAVARRTTGLADDADAEILLVLAAPATTSEQLLGCLDEAVDRGVSVAVGALSGVDRDRVRESAPGVTLVTDGLGWFETDRGEAGIGRLLLVDRDAALVSTVPPGEGDETGIWGSGATNSFVMLSTQVLTATFGPDALAAPPERSGSEASTGRESPSDR